MNPEEFVETMRNCLKDIRKELSETKDAISRLDSEIGYLESEIVSGENAKWETGQ